MEEENTLLFTKARNMSIKIGKFTNCSSMIGKIKNTINRSLGIFEVSRTTLCGFLKAKVSKQFRYHIFIKTPLVFINKVLLEQICIPCLYAIYSFHCSRRGTMTTESTWVRKTLTFALQRNFQKRWKFSFKRQNKPDISHFFIYH